jgi:nucleoid DNA-binding protein
MGIESIKSEVAKIIAVACDITRPQAVKLIEHAVRPVSGIGQRKVAVQGLGDVFLRVEKTASPVRKRGTTQQKIIPSRVVVQFATGTAKKLVTFGGLEGDPKTPPPDFEPIDSGIELGTILGRRGTIFFTRHGHPFVAVGGQAPPGPTPSLKISTLPRQS